MVSSTTRLLFCSKMNNTDLVCSAINNMAFILFWHQQHGSQNWQQLVFLKGDVVWIFSRHGHINQVSQVWRTEWLTEKVRQWSDSDPAEITKESHLAVVVMPWGAASDKSPFAPDGCLLGWPLPPPPPHPPPLCEKLAFSSPDLFLLVRINPHPSFSNSKCWVKVWSVYPICERVAIIVPACQSGWEEMDHLRGNLGKYEEIIQNEISLEGSPTIKVTLICEKNLCALHWIWLQDKRKATQSSQYWLCWNT